MAKPLHEPGVVVDGFRLEEIAHRGGMATLWRVSRAGTTTPMLMKVPKIGEGTDPAAIVSFEMEQMILPRLSGVHVPKCIAVGDFAEQPYIVMECDRRQDFAPAARRTAFALRGSGGDRRENRAGARRSAPPARGPSRHQAEQHHVPADAAKPCCSISASRITTNCRI